MQSKIIWEELIFSSVGISRLIYISENIMQTKNLFFIFFYFGFFYCRLTRGRARNGYEIMYIFYV